MRQQLLSQWVALRCKEPIFQRFLGVSTEAEAIAAVRTRCSVQSRREFDLDPAAAERMHETIRKPFRDFYHAQESTHA
jgi:hypothetical protein